ncbi:WhiB family transcriptional regulator [Nonomuraea gerenzanensis]|uniref:WhiB family transcriptional regulator n=1 Tax=Nonomuraea gerenzanensis TaxID=93944 RepID=UPI001CD96502|nr:WhiB family transcriptional regulator [Nonomuraea gerenzanensis]UBU13991.1 WhiB family transcriptional regulator [Nonomuraea gerenzanensis]
MKPPGTFTVQDHAYDRAQSRLVRDCARGYQALLASVTEGMPRQLAEEGACRFDPDLHAGPDAFIDEPADAKAAREQVAREVCAECPVWASCLFYALDARPEAGVWAGLTPDELATLAGGQGASTPTPREAA